MDVYHESDQIAAAIALAEEDPMATPDLGLITVIVPAYDEEDAIAETIAQVREAMAGSAYDHELIVVDDGSSDCTAERARALGARVICHDANRGYGASLKTGIRASKGGWIVITDADGTYPNKRIPDLIEHAGENEMVVGARTGDAARIPLIRRPVKWLLAKLANYLAETKIPDYNSGLRVFRKDLALRFFRILPSGFSFTTTITLASLSQGYRVKYVPIAYHKRTGKSKIKPVRDTYNFFMLIVRTVLYFNPLRVFMPAGFALFAMGIAKLIHEIVTGGGIAETSVLLLLAAFQTVALGLLADMIDTRL